MISHETLRKLIANGNIHPDLADRYVRNNLPEVQAIEFERSVQAIEDSYKHKLPGRMEEPKAIPISKIERGYGAREHEEYERQRITAMEAMVQERAIKLRESNPFAGYMGNPFMLTTDTPQAPTKDPSRRVIKTLYLKI